VQQQLDRLDPRLVYFQRDFGAVGVLRYPLDRFRRVELELTAGGVDRYCLDDLTGNLILFCGGFQTLGGPYDPGGAPGGPGADTAVLFANWRAKNAGIQAQVSPTVRFGYDTVRYDELTGPIDGTSLMLEAGGGWLPGRQAAHGFARVEAARWWQLIGRANFMLRAGAAGSFSPDERGRLWERTWWLSSADNLRGFSPFDFQFLIGRGYYVANAELQLPLDPILHLVIFDTIEGVAALDFGSVFDTVDDRRLADGTVRYGLWGGRTLTGVLGINMLLGPLLLRLHWGHPFDIGGLPTPALLAGDKWVTNFTIRYFFF